MLAAMRKGAGTWVARIFLGLLVLSFGVWGIGDLVRGFTDTSVAKVGDVKISQRDFDIQYKQELQQLQQRLKTAVDSEQARKLGLPEATLQRMIARSLLEQEARRLGLNITDEVIALEIRRNPMFQNSLGQFDKFVFERVLANQGWSERYYVQLARQDMMLSQLQGAVESGANVAPQPMVDALLRYREERRSADLVAIPNNKVGPIPDPDEAELEKFHQDNAGRFTAPEFRKLSFVTLTAADVADRITVPDQDVRDEYDNKHDRYVVPEKRTVEQLVYPTEAAAKAAYAKLGDGGNFIAVGKETLNLEPRDMSLGSLAKADLPGPVGDAAFQLAKGGISTPVQSPLGWHIVRVTAIEPGSTRSFDEVKDELRKELALRLAGDELFKLSNQLQDQLAGGATIAEAAAKLNLKLHEVAAVDAAGDDPAGKRIEDLPKAANFLQSAFDATVGGDPQVIEMPDGGYFLLKVEASTPPTLQPLATIRDRVVAAWKEQQRGQAAAKLAKEIADKVKAGSDLAALAKEHGLELQKTAPMSRTGLGAEGPVSPQLLAALFKAATGEVVAAPTPEGYAVARLDKIEEAAVDPAAKERLSQALTAALADDAAGQFRAELQRDFGVSINRKNVESVF